jgi:paired amphipathic helix protein Sin3a
MQLAAEKHQSLQANPTSVELGLDDPNGPSVVLAQAKESLGDHGASDSVNVIYMYLLDACEKVFDNDLDPAIFEEHMRWFFGNKVRELIGRTCRSMVTLCLGLSCVYLG